jgi:flavin-dependent dehydrogenase
VTVDVLVVGAGPAGLSAAAELRRLGVGSVLVADREAEPGGIPRHSWHTGYGVRDLHRVMTGPAYARALAGAAVAAGVSLRLGTTVTGWSGVPDGPDGYAATLVSARGLETVRAAAVMLATGCRGAAAVDLTERDHGRGGPGCRPSPAGPVRAAQPGVPPTGPAGGPAG